MSRIGRLPVRIPKGIKVSVTPGSVKVEGGKAAVTRAIDPDVTIEVSGGITPETAERMYSWARYRGRLLRGGRAATLLVRNQFGGLEKADGTGNVSYDPQPTTSSRPSGAPWTTTSASGRPSSTTPSLPAR